MGTWEQGDVGAWGTGSSCLQWVHGGQGGQSLTVGTWGHGYMGEGVQLLTVGT